MSDTAHVVPVGDLIEHDLTDDCMCGPRQELVRLADGSDGWLVVHHSLDGARGAGAEERSDGRGVMP